jgi:hypothetical protein
MNRLQRSVTPRFSSTVMMTVAPRLVLLDEPSSTLRGATSLPVSRGAVVAT